MNDEIKVGDTVMYSLSSKRYTVRATLSDWLWIEAPDGVPTTVARDGYRKVKAPTPCPEGWANANPDRIGPFWPTRERADDRAHPTRIGVVHLSPNGDCEFIRTEGL